MSPPKEPTAPLKQPETLEERVQIIVAEILTQEDENVTMNAHVVHDLGADSLDEVEIVMRLEEEFRLDIPDDDIDRFQTVQNYVDYLREHGVDKNVPATKHRRKVKRS